MITFFWPRKAALLFLLTSAAMVLCETSSAAQRVALVIGNGSYSSVGALTNPIADAELIASTLEELGFETTLVLDTSQLGMKRAIAEFGRNLRRYEKDAIGFFYFAGHGIQARGRNYLLPIEAAPSDAADLDLVGVEADWVLRQMESAGNRTNIIVLDACRNNPFVASNRSVDRGLAQIEAPTGSFISYATAPGKVALDGDGKNSPFTTALVDALPQKGLAIEQVFKRVRLDVIKATDGAQVPWDSSSLVEEFYMTADDAKEEQLAISNEPTETEVQLWSLAKRTGDTNRISLFLQLYPQSQFASDARALLTEKLMAINEPPNTSIEIDIQNQKTVDRIEPVVDEPVVNEVQEQTPAAPSVDEMDLFNRIAANNSLDDLELYIETFPEGRFIDFVKAELAEVHNKEANQPATEEPLSTVEASIDTTAKVTNTDTGLIEYAYALGRGVVVENEDLSLSEIITRSPLFSPIPGLDESFWKEQTCSNCHSWDKEALCTQGNFYVDLDQDATAALERIQHPFGGKFKVVLREWAELGCN